jgi:hypothetical protein
MAIRICFPSKYGKLGRTVFSKKSFVQVAAPFLISPPQKKKSFSLELVLSSIIVCILTLFWGRGRIRLVNRQEYASRRTLKEKRAQKKQGNFVRSYYWVLNNYKGLAFCVRVFCAALLFFVFTSGVIWRNSTPEGGECERVSGWSFADEGGASSWWREKELESIIFWREEEVLYGGLRC